MDIDVEKLVILVEERPVLWNKNCEDYKNKRLTIEAWKEVCLNMVPEFQSLPNTEKNDLGKRILKKWANMRDTWVKCHKKINEHEPRTKTKPIRKYLYYDQMQFLTKIVNHKGVKPGMFTADDDKNQVKNDDKTTDTNIGLNGSPSKKIKLIESSKRDDHSTRITSFFKSIAPTVERFNDEDIVEFQFEVMNTIRNIKRKNQVNNVQELFEYHPTGPACSSGLSSECRHSQSSDCQNDNNRESYDYISKESPLYSEERLERPNSPYSIYSDSQRSSDSIEDVKTSFNIVIDDIDFSK